MHLARLCLHSHTQNKIKMQVLACQGPHHDKHNIKLLSWNIDGLRSKLDDIDFIKYLNSFDIFGLIETWEISLSEQMTSLFPKFNIYVCEAIKQAKFGRAMAGVFVFVRKEYDQFITRLNTECKFAVFLNCSKRIFKVPYYFNNSVFCS